MSASYPIHVARVYDPPETWHGAHLLVDRLWPRGIAKADLRLDAWPKDVTPSTELRKWFHADIPARWPEFQHRYGDELNASPEAVAECLNWCRKGPVTLLTASTDRDHNQAVALRDYLQAHLAGGAA